MRYSILNATLQQVQLVGGQEIRHAPNTNIIFTTLTNEQAEKLRAMGCVVNEIKTVKTSVLPPAPVTAQPLYTPSDIISICGYGVIASMVSPPLYGSGINVAVIGTGIRETHELVKGRVVYSKNYTTAPMTDGFNHDTAVCSIIVAFMPKCNILNLKVMDDAGNGTEESVVLAIDDCISMIDSGSEYAPHLINLSLGAPDTGDPNDVMRVACRAALDKQIRCIAAAGNGGPSSGTIMSPGCERYVAAIGSIKYISEGNTFTISDFSSRGPTVEGLVKPDAVSFGENLIVASSESDTDTIAKSGTSFATPGSVGVSGLILEYYFRGAGLTQEAQFAVKNIPAAVLSGSLPSIADSIDIYVPMVSVKPSGVPAAKDDDYGSGLLLGELVKRAVSLLTSGGAGLDINTMVSMVMAIGMLGMMMKVVGKTKTRVLTAKVGEAIRQKRIEHREIGAS